MKAPLLYAASNQPWQIGINTASASPTITLRGTGPVVIDWGDGTTPVIQALTTGSDTNVSHTYSPAGAYTITIYNAANLTRFYTASNCAWAFDLSSVPRSVMTYFACTGSNTITGNLSSLPSVMTYFLCTGSNTITGNLSSLPSVMTYFLCTGSNTINAYTTGHTWASAMNYFYLITNSGGLTSAMVDSLCIDLDTVPWGGGGRVLQLTGAGIGAPTAASSAARTDLTTNKSVTVTTN